MRSFRPIRLLAAAALSLAGPVIPACAEPLAFATDGGDAWTFEKPVEGLVEGACDELVVRAPGGAVPAWRSGDRFGALAELRAGENVVRAVCLSDGRERAAAEQRWFVRLDEAPTARIRVAAAAGRIALDAGASAPAETDAAPIVRFEWRARADNPAPLDLPVSGERVAFAAPAVDGDYVVILRAIDALGRADESAAVFRVESGAARTVDPAREPPAWAKGAVVYGVAPHFFPGGFAGVADRLDEIAALGATALWLSPATAAPADDFGYAVVDHFSVNPRFGGAQGLSALIAAAHARGLKVIVDFVPNHAADEHPYHQDAERRGPRSPYWRFFEREPDGEPAHYFGWERLNNLNYDEPEVQAWMLEAFAWWVRAFDVDGFRVDVAWGVRERAPEFWPRWRAELKRIKPDLLLIAEAGARDPWYAANGFDVAYDWTDRLGEWAWAEAFERPGETARLLRAALAAAPEPGRVFRFLNNNDTGPRFLSRYGPETTRVAAAMLLTLPGLPLVYMGDEVGAAFEPYAEGPPLQWADPHGLADWYARLIRLRRAESALRAGGLRLLDDGPDHVLAYLRAGPPGANVLIALNYGAAPAELRLGRLGDGAVDLLDGAPTPLDPVSVPAHGVRVLRVF